MRKPFFKYLILLAFIALLSTCKKYPEDTFLSFTTSNHRLEGEWQIEKLEINGENVESKYNDSLAPLALKDYRFWFKFNQKIYSNLKETAPLFLINKSEKRISIAADDTEVCGCNFALTTKKREIFIGTPPLYYIPGKDPIGFKIFSHVFSYYPLWEIRSLHNKVLIIEQTVNNVKQKIYFKKIARN